MAVIKTTPKKPVALPIDLGALFTFTVTIKEDGRPFNLTAFTGRGDIRVLKDKTSQLLASFTVAKVAPDTQGKMTVTLGATVTNTLPNRTMFFDVEIENGGDPDDVRRIVQGTLVPDDQVTAA